MKNIDKQLDDIENMLDNSFVLDEFPEIETDNIDDFNFSLDEDY